MSSRTTPQSADATSVDNDALLTTTDAARVAQRSAEAIRYWANTGRLAIAYRTASGLRLFRRANVLRAVGKAL